MIGASGVAVLTTIGIIFSLIFETFMFFQKVPVLDFLFGLHWYIAIREIRQPIQVSSAQSRFLRVRYSSPLSP